MKKLLTTLTVGMALSAPALYFIIRYYEVPQSVWQEDPEKVYFSLLEGELLSGSLSRSEFIDRLKEKAALTAQAPLPVEAFIKLYNLAEQSERLQLRPLLPYILNEATTAEAKQLKELQKDQ